MDQGVIRSLKAQQRSGMIQQITKAIDANKYIQKVNILDVMKMLAVCCEGVTKETVKSVSLNLGFHQNTKPVHKII